MFSKQHGRGQLLVMLALVGLALLAGVYLSLKNFEPVEPQRETRTATFLNPTKPLPDFTLIRGDGEVFARQAFRGRWSVVFFGYTQCPDICPTTLNLMRLVAREVPADKVNYVFISVDPERDKPEQLKQFTSYFNENFIGATAEIEAMQPLLKSLGVVFARTPAPSGDGYLIDHSAALYVISPAAELAAVITPPHDVKEIVHDLQLLVE
jgi:protein SCO1/2